MSFAQTAVLLGTVTLRVCAACHSTITYVMKNGYPDWRKHEDDIMCKKCYNFYVHNPAFNPCIIYKYHPEKVAKHNLRRINPRGKFQYHLKENPRKGMCQWCGLKIGDTYTNFWGKQKIVKRTHMHHLEYDENDPLAHTVELCMSCHGRETWKERRNRSK